MKWMKQLLAIALALGLVACQSQHQDDSAAAPQVSKRSQAASYNVQLGLGYLKQGDRPRAKEKLLTALRQDPQSADVNAAMAYFLEETGEVQDASQYYKRAIDKAMHKGAQYNNYGAFLCRQGEYRQAERYFLKAVEDEHYIHTAGAYENAGLCVLSIPDTAKAKTYFKKALEQDPMRKQSLFELVKLDIKAGEGKAALDTLLNHPELNKDPEILALSERIAREAGRDDLAAEYKRMMQDNKNYSDNTGADNEYNSHNG